MEYILRKENRTFTVKPDIAGVYEVCRWEGSKLVQSYAVTERHSQSIVKSLVSQGFTVDKFGVKQ